MLRNAPVCALLALLAACASDADELEAAGNLHFNRGEYARARDAYRRAVEASPRDPGPRVLLGNALVELGDYPAARAQFERALALAPGSAGAHRGLMTVISHTAPPGDGEAFARYLGHARALLDAHPGDRNTLIMTGAILSEAANPADPEAYARAQREAERTLRRGLRLDDRDPKLLFHLALVYARLGELAPAERVLARLRGLAVPAGFADYAAAIVYTLAGRRDQALAAVEALLAHPAVEPDSLLARTSYLAPLHADPRFVALVEAARATRAGAAPAPPR